MIASATQLLGSLRALASEAQHSDEHARMETDLLDDIAIALRQAADALASKLADAWDEGAEYAVDYSTAPLYDNPYRAEATA